MRPVVLVLAGAIATLGAWSSSAETATQVAQHLRDGYEIKAAFSDNGGGAYLVLQKGTSAYLCHSSPNQVCEKLN